MSDASTPNCPSSAHPLPFTCQEERQRLLSVFSPARIHQYTRLEREPERNRIALLNLRLEHNTSLPVNRLPPEILSYIMVEAESVEDFHDWPAGWNVSIRTPACVQVCALWREVALNTPRLWTNLDLRCPTALAFCGRSSNARLRISYTPNSRPRATEAFNELILKQSHRLSALRVKGTQSVLHETLKQLQENTPVLETLHIVRPVEYKGSKLKRAFVQCLHKLHTPNLRRLCMHGISHHSRWRSPWLRSLNLRRLEMNCAPWGEPNAKPPILDDLLDTLQSFPLLERLSITDSLPVAIPPQIPSAMPLRTVHLPALRDVTCHGTIPGCITLLRHLRFPGRVQLRVDCTEGDIAHLPHLWPLVKPHCELSDVSVEITPGSVYAFFGTAGTYMLFECFFTDGMDIVFEELASSCFPTPEISKLTLCADLPDRYRVSRNLMQAVLSNCQNVRHLSLRCMQMTVSVLDALQFEHKQAGHVKLLPKLTHLSIRLESRNIRRWFGPCRAELARRQAASPQECVPFQSLHIDGREHVNETKIRWLKRLLPASPDALVVQD